MTIAEESLALHYEKKGKIEIEYFSKEELERITDILSNN